MPYTILLIDDDRDFCKEFAEYFYDYNILEANDGLEALKIIKKINVIDLVVLDVRMPGLKGPKVLEEIKKIKPNLYTIMLTGFSSEDTAIQSLKAHADDYMQKPVKFSKFREIVEAKIVKNEYIDDLESDSIKAKIIKIKHYIDKNYEKIFNLNDISKIVCLSPKYLSRVFKEETGICFNEYKLGVKVRYSKELLKDTGANVDQIAYKLGYKNSESFIKIFKKITGLTPTEYRLKPE